MVGCSHLRAYYWVAEKSVAAPTVADQVEVAVEYSLVVHAVGGSVDLVGIHIDSGRNVVELVEATWADSGHVVSRILDHNHLPEAEMAVSAFAHRCRAVAGSVGDNMQKGASYYEVDIPSVLATEVVRQVTDTFQ